MYMYVGMYTEKFSDSMDTVLFHNATLHAGRISQVLYYDTIFI